MTQIAPFIAQSPSTLSRYLPIPAFSTAQVKYERYVSATAAVLRNKLTEYSPLG